MYIYNKKNNIILYILYYISYTIYIYSVCMFVNVYICIYLGIYVCDIYRYLSVWSQSLLELTRSHAGRAVRLRSTPELSWAPDEINLDVEGRSICTEEPAFKLVIRMPDLVGESWTCLFSITPARGKE